MENPKSELKFKKIPGQNILLGIDIGGSLSKISIVTANSEKETIRDILKEYKNLKELETNDFILNLLFFKSSDIIPLLKSTNLKPLNNSHKNILKPPSIFTTEITPKYNSKNPIFSRIPFFFFYLKIR